MGEEVKKVEGGAGPEDRVKSLEEALSVEKAKNEVLMEQILKSENTLAEKDVEGFADVIPNEDRDFWRGQLLENRENATAILSRMRGRVAPAAAAEPPVAVPPVAPSAGSGQAVPPVAPSASSVQAVPKPLHNRETAKPAVAEKGAVGGADRAAKLRNRAQEISRLNGCSFTVAFRRAEAEISG